MPDEKYAETRRMAEVALRESAGATLATDWQAAALAVCRAVLEASHPTPIVQLNGYQLRDALEFSAPDGTADQLQTEVCIQYGPARTDDEGSEPAGMFCWYSEYPEEGSIRLSEGPDDCFANCEQPAPQPAEPVWDGKL